MAPSKEPPPQSPEGRAHAFPDRVLTPSGKPPPQSMRGRYEALIASGEIERDPAQEQLVAKYSALEQRLTEHRMARKSSALGWLFGRRENTQQLIKGLYIFGDVGRGKTMLMDLFFAASPIQRKRRAHFHEFMLDVHDRVHTWRQQRKRGEVKGDDPIEPLASALADEAWLLCFDEFHVTDIADAMILARLFKRLFELGVVVVATSNVDPDDLYRDGLNRALFLPFIDLLKQQCEIVRLTSRTDFRLEKLAGAPVYYVPGDNTNDGKLDDAWRRLTGGEKGEPRTLKVHGRDVVVPLAAIGVARFTFDDLCRKPHGAADFLKIAHEFHTLIISGIPVMRYENRNEAKRFITLIDTLYDTSTKLVASADAEPEGLYLATEGVEQMEFRRTISRLTEMRSDEYLALPHGKREGQKDVGSGVIDT
jgi:cell division protein ZapE